MAQKVSNSAHIVTVLIVYLVQLLNVCSVSGWPPFSVPGAGVVHNVVDTASNLAHAGTGALQAQHADFQALLAQLGQLPNVSCVPLTSLSGMSRTVACGLLSGETPPQIGAEILASTLGLDAYRKQFAAGGKFAAAFASANPLAAASAAASLAGYDVNAADALAGLAGKMTGGNDKAMKLGNLMGDAATGNYAHAISEATGLGKDLVDATAAGLTGKGTNNATHSSNLAAQSAGLQKLKNVTLTATDAAGLAREALCGAGDINKLATDAAHKAAIEKAAAEACINVDQLKHAFATIQNLLPGKTNSNSNLAAAATTSKPFLYNLKFM